MTTSKKALSIKERLTVAKREIGNWFAGADKAESAARVLSGMSRDKSGLWKKTGHVVMRPADTLKDTKNPSLYNLAVELTKANLDKEGAIFDGYTCSQAYAFDIRAEKRAAGGKDMSKANEREINKRKEAKKAAQGKVGSKLQTLRDSLETYQTGSNRKTKKEAKQVTPEANAERVLKAAFGIQLPDALPKRPDGERINGNDLNEALNLLAEVLGYRFDSDKDVLVAIK